MTKPQILRHVTIVAAERLNNSVNGNPRYRLALSDGNMYLTQSDAACSYDVDNYRRSGEAFDAELTRAGRISVIWKLGERA